MLIYNVTIKVDASIADEWVNWLNEVHKVEVLNTGCFSAATLLRLLECDDSEGPTYAVQYITDDIMKYNKYINEHANDMRKKSFDKWGDKFIAFRSLMQVVN